MHKNDFIGQTLHNIWLIRNLIHVLWIYQIRNLKLRFLKYQLNKKLLDGIILYEKITYNITFFVTHEIIANFIHRISYFNIIIAF